METKVQVALGDTVLGVADDERCYQLVNSNYDGVHIGNYKGNDRNYIELIVILTH